MDQHQRPSPPVQQSHHPRSHICSSCRSRCRHVPVLSPRFHPPQKNKGRYMPPNPNHGIVCKKSKHSVDETVEKLESILQAKGVILFALVDHSGEAQKVGLTMPPTKLLIFGNPKGGTPLMLASPSIALDLPLKILVWQDTQGKTWVTYNSPEYLRERHNLPPELLPNIAVIETLATKAAE